MPSKTPTGKKTKGSVAIIISNNRLQLRFQYAKKRRYLSLGLSDTLINRRLSSDPQPALQAKSCEA